MPLSADAIVETAHSLLRDYGLQDVSMRRLAHELDVRPGALYYHVPNKQELLARVAARILAPLADAPQSGGVPALMGRFRETVLPLRDGGDLMLIAFGLDAELPPVPALRGLLHEAGLEPQAAERRAHIIMRFALGAVAAEQNAALLSSPEAGPAQQPHTAGGAALFDEGLRLLCGPPE